ncbi:MAG: MoaD/ThiS family protein [Oscillospiraceae bacterium]|nr:MoaD/ThiS family protein [Oscillospiraceae bacterium]
MITVKLYGLLRLDSGIKEQTMEAESVRAVLEGLSRLGVDRKALSGCVMIVNGTPGTKRTKLKPGDVVQLLPPVAGG